MNDFPETGKIQNSFFKEKVFPYCGAVRDEVVIGPEYGVDVSIVNRFRSYPRLAFGSLRGYRYNSWLTIWQPQALHHSMHSLP
jgi:hypothetical protein